MSVFEITIQREDEDNWPVVVRHQPGAQALAQRSRGRLDLDLARLEALRSTEKEYGTLLGQALFREEIRDAFARALTGTSGGDEPLRVLLIVEADALRNLHWEQLCAPWIAAGTTCCSTRRPPSPSTCPARSSAASPPSAGAACGPSKTRPLQARSCSPL